MNDEQLFLANAYVDGELTDDERRTAAADPDVMAEVERLHALRAEVRTVPVAPAGAREAAITAAMAEFRATTAGATAEPAEADVVPFRPRPAYAKYLAVAAALVAVAGLGIVVSQVGGGGADDDDAASVEDAAIAESSARDEVLSTVAATDMADDDVIAEADSALDESAGDAGAGAVAEEEMAEEPAEEPASEEVLEAAPAEDEDETVFGADAATSRIAVPPGFDPDAPIFTDTGLAIYGSFLIGQRELRLLGPTPETRCDGDYDVLATTIYVADGEGRLVFVAVNEDEGVVLALDSDTCAVLGTGDLF